MKTKIMKNKYSISGFKKEDQLSIISIIKTIINSSHIKNNKELIIIETEPINIPTLKNLIGDYCDIKNLN